VSTIITVRGQTQNEPDRIEVEICVDGRSRWIWLTPDDAKEFAYALMGASQGSTTVIEQGKRSK